MSMIMDDCQIITLQRKLRYTTTLGQLVRWVRRRCAACRHQWLIGGVRCKVDQLTIFRRRGDLHTQHRLHVHQAHEV